MKKKSLILSATLALALTGGAFVAPQTALATERNLTVNAVADWHGYRVSAVSANSLSAETAANIGVDYLERFFEVDLSGANVHMVYFGATPSREVPANATLMGATREQGDWYGVIMPAGATVADHFAAFSFKINGSTGELLNIQRNLAAETLLSRGMSIQDGARLEMELLFGANPHVTVGERGAFVTPNAPEGAGVIPVFELPTARAFAPFTTTDSITYARHAMDIAERLNMLSGDIARAQVWLDQDSAVRRLNADLELSALVSVRVQNTAGDDVVFTFTTDDHTLMHLDFGQNIYFPTRISGFDTNGNPIDPTITMTPQPTRFDWVTR